MIYKAALLADSSSAGRDIFPLLEINRMLTRRRTSSGKVTPGHEGCLEAYPSISVPRFQPWETSLRLERFINLLRYAYYIDSYLPV